MSFFDEKTRIANIDYRINLYKQRGEGDRLKLINALLREKRLLEKRANENVRPM